MVARSTPMEIVDSAEGLTALVERLSTEKRIVIDTESNSFHRFPERICLVQIGAAGRAWVVDPLPLSREETAPLGRLLAQPSIVKVMHAAANDIRAFDKEWSFPTVNVFDTSTAARFCGMDRVGLDTVLEETLGVIIVKSKNLQRADWTLRPLSEEALRYAVNDVAHLTDLQDALSAKVDALGRTDWVAEEFRRLEDVRYRAPDPPEIAFLGAKGSRELDARGLAILRELYVFRHNEGLRSGVPPFRILSERALIDIAKAGGGELSPTPDLPRGVLNRWGKRLQQARDRGLNAEPFERPRGNPSREPRIRGRRVSKSSGSRRSRHGGPGTLLDLALTLPLFGPCRALNCLRATPPPSLGRREENHSGCVGGSSASLASCLRGRWRARGHLTEMMPE